MKPVLIMALAEVREGLRNRWIIASILTLGLFALSLALLGSTPVGEINASAMNITTVSLASLSVYLVPLIALMLAFDAIVGESERGTLLLLLTYPIKRWQVIIGKFIGHVCILSIAVVIGYGLVGLYISLNHPTGIVDWTNYFDMISTTILLGSVFLSIGYLVSVLFKERSTAIGVSIAIWLVLIIVYDFLLLGLVLGDTEKIINGNILAAAIYLNPADIYRLFNLAGNESAKLISGMGDLGGTVLLQPWSMLAALLFWMLVPLVSAVMIFHRKEI